VLIYEALMLQFGELVGRQPLILPVPVLTPQLSSYWLNLVTAVPTNIARALIAGLEHDVVADATAIRGLIPIPLKTYREAAQAALTAERASVTNPRWMEGSMVYRQNRPDFAFYAKQMSGAAMSDAPAEALWREVASIGGDNGYYYLDALWKVRGCVDVLTGGTGLRRGRRDPHDIAVKDAIDFWRVVAVKTASAPDAHRRDEASRFGGARDRVATRGGRAHAHRGDGIPSSRRRRGSSTGMRSPRSTW
jgi:hypothetical protein